MDKPRETEAPAETGAPASRTASVGDRVVRKDTDERGTVVEADGKIKVKWDKGATSYFKRGAHGNVRKPKD